MSRGRSIVVQLSDGASAYPGARPLVEAGYHTVLATPLIDGDRVIGAVLFPSDNERAYSDLDLNLADQIGIRMTAGISNAAAFEELIQRYEELDDATQRERLSGLAEMAKAITHHLNNKLTPILGFSELLLSRADMLHDDEIPGRYLQAIHEASQNAASFVEDLREFHREREYGEAYHEQVKLDEIARLTLTLAQPLHEDQEEGKRGAIQVETNLKETSSVYGNGSEIQQALANLILNATEAMPQGGTLSVGTRQAEGRVALFVGDTGVGMTPDVRERCLDPLYTTKGPGRSGIGLSIVHGVVRRHEAALEIESRAGVGTTVTIFFRV